MIKAKTFILCSLAELKERKQVTTWVEEFKDEISAFYIDEEINVFSTICPHFGGDFDLNEKKCQLVCRWHGWKFDLKTGHSVVDIKSYQNDSLIRKILEGGNRQLLGCFPFKGKLKSYAFRCVGDDLEVMIP